MRVSLVSLGSGRPETVTAEGLAALREAACILGAERLLEHLPEGCTPNRAAAVRPQALLEAILEQDGDCAVVYSGDAGFYSGARGLLPLLEEAGIPARVLPGVSSVQMLSARLGRSWQDWVLVSAHGTECDVIKAVTQGRPAFFLTGGALGPGEICARLRAAGLGELPVTVGENLSCPDERLLSGTAEELAEKPFAALSVLLAEAAPRPERRCAGYPDSAFLRGGVPMTKQEVRAAALAKLAVRPGETFWDVGAGTGSVSVELALAAEGGRVFAAECESEACNLIRANREKFRAWNLKLVEGRAPAALEALPAPDGVFIGGSKGALEEITALALARNSRARICVAAIALETLSAASAALARHGIEAQVTQIAVSRSRPAGRLHLLAANNPIFLITGNCDA